MHDYEQIRNDVTKYENPLDKPGGYYVKKCPHCLKNLVVDLSCGVNPELKKTGDKANEFFSGK